MQLEDEENINYPSEHIGLQMQQILPSSTT